VTLPPLLAITPGDGRPLGPWIDALAGAGLRLLLVREPQLDDAGLRALVERAGRLLTVVVHARHPAAASTGAGRHVADGHPPEGPYPRGASCHDGAGLDAAFAGGADYALLSPVWRPTSKPDDTRPTLGLPTFLRLAAGRIVYALGGATPSRLAAVRRRGGHGVAVLGDLFGRPTPGAAARRLATYMDVLE
jgi:thiamine-phosphate pyrophosphorylase